MPILNHLARALDQINVKATLAILDTELRSAECVEHHRLLTAWHLLDRLGREPLVMSTPLAQTIEWLVPAKSDGARQEYEAELLRAIHDDLLYLLGAESIEALHRKAASAQRIAFQTSHHRIVEAADGDWHWMESGRPGGGAAVIPVIGEHVLLLEIARPNLGYKLTFEFPGGGVDEGETYEEGAARELYEETGLQIAADELISLGSVQADVGWTNHKIPLFLAEFPEGTEVNPLDRSEVSGSTLVHKDELLSWLAAREVRDTKTLAMASIFATARLPTAN